MASAESSYTLHYFFLDDIRSTPAFTGLASTADSRVFINENVKGIDFDLPRARAGGRTAVGFVLWGVPAGTIGVAAGLWLCTAACCVGLDNDHQLCGVWSDVVYEPL